MHRTLEKNAQHVRTGEGTEGVAAHHVNWTSDPGPPVLDDRSMHAKPNAADGASEQTALYPITRGIFAIPILANNYPDLAHCAEGFTIAIGADEVTFEIAARTGRVPSKWVVGIEKDNGQLGYFAVTAREVKECGSGLHINGTLLVGADEPLSPQNLSPVFDSRTCQFRPRLAPQALDKWEQLGIIEPVCVDCVLVCPRCSSVPTIRLGCRACGSIAVDADELIHHFACAHVDRVDRFEVDNHLICPKCRANNLVVGADFEFVSGPFVCRECHWSDSELESIGRCMACNHEFPLDHAAEKEVIEYHVDRLEPLDLVPAR
jgi:hypothetical protein